MRATPPARTLAWVVDALDRFWGPLVLLVVVLGATVFAPRQLLMAMIVGGCVGAAALVLWLFDRLGRPRSRERCAAVYSSSSRPSVQEWSCPTWR
jgi:hypothetical protein